MIIQEANTEDRQMYFGGTYMRHTKLGIGHIRIGEGDNRMYICPIESKTYTVVNPKDLSIWLPMPKAVNVDNRALYIGRTAPRSMKKSAAPNMYYMKPFSLPFSLMIALLLENTKYPTWKKAISKLNVGKSNSLAITPDIILGGAKKGKYVTHKGIRVGIIEDDKNFIPDNPRSPINRRVLAQIATTGGNLVCQAG